VLRFDKGASWIGEPDAPSVQSILPNVEFSWLNRDAGTVRQPHLDALVCCPSNSHVRRDLEWLAQYEQDDEDDDYLYDDDCCSSD